MIFKLSEHDFQDDRNHKIFPTRPPFPTEAGKLSWPSYNPFILFKIILFSCNLENRVQTIAVMLFRQLENRFPNLFSSFDPTFFIPGI
jgi:hypothetical protein